MSKTTFTWTLSGSGWADCVVADEHSQAEATASYITDAPEHLLTAVARLVLGEAETRAQFEAEPTAFRWIFYRAGEDAWIRLLGLADRSRHDNTGTEVWSSRQTLDTLARAFDDVVQRHGESEYQDKWHWPFPRTELEVLRTAWRDHTAQRRATSPHPGLLLADDLDDVACTTRTACSVVLGRIPAPCPFGPPALSVRRGAIVVPLGV